MLLLVVILLIFGAGGGWYGYVEWGVEGGIVSGLLVIVAGVLAFQLFQ